ncbi:MAG: hypothetical protein AB1861_18430, partial [Cyanobacteriota bacterium]
RTFFGGRSLSGNSSGKRQLRFVDKNIFPKTDVRPGVSPSDRASDANPSWVICLTFMRNLQPPSR